MTAPAMVAKQQAPQKEASQERPREAMESSRERQTRAMGLAGGSGMPADRPDGDVRATVRAALTSPGEPVDPGFTSFLSADLLHATPSAPSPGGGSFTDIGPAGGNVESQADRIARSPGNGPPASVPGWLGHVRVHTGDAAARAADAVHAEAFTVGRDVVFGRNAWQPGSNDGRQLLAHELAHVLQQSGGVGSGLLMRKPKKSTSKTPSKGTQFWFSVRVSKPLNADELLVEFVMQYREIVSEEGARRDIARLGWRWTDKPQTATAADAAKGYKLVHVTDLSVSATSPGERERLNKRFGALGGDEQSGINAETDRQFWEKTKYKPNTKLGKSADDQKMAEYWRQLRDELMRKRELIDSLPPNLRKFIFTEGATRTIGPNDYDAILRIADKLRDLTDAELQDYKNKVTGETTSLAQFESSIDRYLSTRKERIAERKVRETRRTRIYGMESIFRLYKSWKAAEEITHLPGPSTDREGGGYEQPSDHQQRADDLHRELVTALDARGFDSIAEFEEAIDSYIEAFEKETLRVAEDMLSLYEHVLYEAEKKYRDPNESMDLYKKVSGSAARSQYDEAKETRESAWRSASPAGFITPGTFNKFEEADALESTASKSVSAAAVGHPLVANKDFERKDLAYAQPHQVGGMMQNYINDRRDDIAETRGHLKKDPGMIWKLDELYKASFRMQAIDPESIYGMVVEDRRRSINRKGIIKAIVVAVIAVAVTLLTFGTGTIAVLAAGAAFGLSAYQAIEAFKEYEVKHAAYGAQLLSDDPSFAWVIVAIVGAGLDLGAAVTIFSKGTQAAKAIEAFNSGGDLVKLEKELATVAELSEGMRMNVLRAAEAESEFRKAARGLLSITSRVASNPFFEPELWVKFVKVVYYGLKRGLIAFDDFIKQLRIEKILKETALEPEEIAHFTEAFEAAKTAVDDITKHGKAIGLADEQIDTFFNMWAKTKEMKTEDVLEYMTKWLEKSQSGIPFGIADDAALEAFKAAATKGIKKAGYKDGSVILQGSAMTGVKWEGKIARLEPNDLDVAITSRQLFKKAEKLNYPVERNPMRIGPLSEDQIRELGLHKMREGMEDAIGNTREVNFMLFANDDAALKGIQGTNPPSLILE